MDFKVTLISWEKMELLIDDCNSLETDTFDSFGLKWPVGEDFEEIRSRAVEMGWRDFDNNSIALIVMDERKWFLTKLKYGI